MQLTRAADYAVRVMVHLAGLKPGVRASRAELADAAGCPEQFLAKVMQTLARAQMVISHRGNTGGFELPEAQRRASLLDVIEAVEGPIHLNLCIDSACGCERKSWCPAHRVWVEAQVAMTGVLRNARLDDLARQTGRTVWN
ncbi:MAG: Rrf2 family transcriptional regulator [Bryobacteraceae bacterium]